jgi:hypothetical protein
VEDNGLRLWTFRHFYLIDLTRRNSSFTLSVSTLPSTIFRGEYSARLQGRAPWGRLEEGFQARHEAATCTQGFADDPASVIVPAATYKALSGVRASQKILALFHVPLATNLTKTWKIRSELRSMSHAQKRGFSRGSAA